MKTKLVVSVILTTFLFLGCSNNEDNVEELGLDSQDSSLSKSSLASKKGSSISQPFAQAQSQVQETFFAIAASITAGAGNGADGMYMDELISFHAYGPKFTEFNYDSFGKGTLYDSAGNEGNERALFGDIVDVGGVVQFGYLPGTLKIAVYYGHVANLTFISDFHLMIGGELQIVNNLITLLFVKTNGEWKLVHEHHSPAQLYDPPMEF